MYNKFICLFFLSTLVQLGLLCISKLQMIKTLELGRIKDVNCALQVLRLST